MKEIDFLKTGVRWHLSRRLRHNLKKLPFFLLNNYDKKLNRYYKIAKFNKDSDIKIPLNCFFSPSPMNELCDYINTWEMRNIVWDTTCRDNRDIILNHDIQYDNQEIRKQVRKIINDYYVNFRQTLLKINDNNNSLTYLSSNKEDYDDTINLYATPFIEELNNLPYDKTIIKNYVVNECYRTKSLSKLFAWIYAGDVILENLKVNTPAEDIKHFKIIEVSSPTEHSHDYLGKHYEMLPVYPDGKCIVNSLDNF